jgi:hypothetical protein
MTGDITAEALSSVGFIGLGDQGLPMAVAIAEAGYPLHVWAGRPASLEALAGVPHARHENLQDLAAAVAEMPRDDLRYPLCPAGPPR